MTIVKVGLGDNVYRVNAENYYNPASLNHRTADIVTGGIVVWAAGVVVAPLVAAVAVQWATGASTLYAIGIGGAIAAATEGAIASQTIFDEKGSLIREARDVHDACRLVFDMISIKLLGADSVEADTGLPS